MPSHRFTTVSTAAMRASPRSTSHTSPRSARFTGGLAAIEVGKEFLGGCHERVVGNIARLTGHHSREQQPGGLSLLVGRERVERLDQVFDGAGHGEISMVWTDPLPGSVRQNTIGSKRNFQR
jgi:hypothetical protein